MTEAERRLAEARARVHELSSAIQAARGFGDWDGLRAAQQEVLAAEREVASLLAVAVCAVLAGASTFAAIAD